MCALKELHYLVLLLGILRLWQRTVRNVRDTFRLSRILTTFRHVRLSQLAACLRDLTLVPLDFLKVFYA